MNANAAHEPTPRHPVLGTVAAVVAVAAVYLGVSAILATMNIHVPLTVWPF